MKKIKLLVALLALAVLVILSGCEGRQKELYDKKADITGTNRTASIYSPIDGTLIKTVSDDSMVIERQGETGMSLWLGSKNKKIYVLNATVIVEDN